MNEIRSRLGERGIVQLYRTYCDEDGTYSWWTDWKPNDRFIGRCREGDRYKIMVEHTDTVRIGHLFRADDIEEHKRVGIYDEESEVRWRVD